tara:strand:+ start:2826 stop:3887 length:1062 start_codon:yes stop_codon:yes gene_type:complete
MAETRSLTFDLDELSNVAILAGKDTRDGLQRRLPLLEACKRIHGEGGITRDGGAKWKQDLEAFEHSVPTALPTGYEEINLDVRSTDRSFIFKPAFVTAPILISQTERNVHNGQAAVNDLGARRTKNVLNAQMRAWHKQALSGGIAGYTDWATLNGLDNPTGLLEEDIVGGQGNSYGGLSKSTLSAVPAMSNQRYDLAGAVGQNGRAGILHVFNNINEVSLEDNTHVVMATQNGLANMQRVMQPYMQYTTNNDGGNVEMLGPQLLINGMPVHATSHLPTTGAVTANDPLSIMVLDFDAIYPVFMKADSDGYFGITDFVQHSGSHRVFVSYVDCNGAWWVRAYNTSAVLFDGETF